MARNVTEVLADRAGTLLEKLVTNPDVCNVVLALLSRCIIVCAQLGKPIEGIKIGHLEAQELVNGDLSLRAPVKFHDFPQAVPSIWPAQHDFGRYTRAKAHGLGLSLQKNPLLGHFFQTLIERLDVYADHKQIAFSFLVVKQAILTTNYRLVLKVGRQLLDA